MTSAQWKAIYDFCDALGCSRTELLKELRACGIIDPKAPIEELGNCVSRKDYDTMLKFLETHI